AGGGMRSWWRQLNGDGTQLDDKHLRARHWSLARTLRAMDLLDLLLLCSPMRNRRRIGFAYQYSLFQLELGRTLLFLLGATMNEVYQKLIDRTRVSSGFEAGQDHLWFLASPASWTKAGTRSRASGQGGGGAEP